MLLHRVSATDLGFDSHISSLRTVMKEIVWLSLCDYVYRHLYTHSVSLGWYFDHQKREERGEEPACDHIEFCPFHENFRERDINVLFRDLGSLILGTLAMVQLKLVSCLHYNLAHTSIGAFSIVRCVWLLTLSIELHEYSHHAEIHFIGQSRIEQTNVGQIANMKINVTPIVSSACWYYCTWWR
jgi:hypothetical protein